MTQNERILREFCRCLFKSEFMAEPDCELQTHTSLGDFPNYRPCRCLFVIDGGWYNVIISPDVGFRVAGTRQIRHLRVVSVVQAARKAA